jgi:hypothetical protein
VGVPLAPETAMATERLCVEVMLLEAGVTVTTGVAKDEVTVTEALPEALL